MSTDVTDNVFGAKTEAESAATPAEGVRTGIVPGEAAAPHTFDFLMGVNLAVSVEVGRIQMPVKAVMDLRPGSVVELQRKASDPVEIFANGRCIGRGEIVVVGEQFGVRVLELGSPG